MQVYLVGGAVRDLQLGKPIKDKDFVVVGATPQQMLDNDFIQVGADFPVFLHPNTKQEYALARTERKSGKGYKGFKVYADENVTLEEDLSRRDLTVNAMAIEVNGLYNDTPKTGEVIDPFNGLDDIKNKKLRHVSEAFSEDPLRVLRVARFYGRFYSLGFKVAKLTHTLLIELASSGELLHLTRERVWSETSRALMQPSPQAYWQLLYDIDAITSLYPQLSNSWKDDNCRHYIWNALQLAGALNLKLEQRWAMVTASFAPIYNNQTTNLSLTACDSLSDSSGKDIDNTDWTTAVKQIGQENKLPKKLTHFALLYAQYADYLHFFDTLTAAQMATLITACKAQKDTQVLKDLLTLSHVLLLTKLRIKLDKIVDKFNSITIKDIDDGLQGAQIGEEINKLRIKAIATL